MSKLALICVNPLSIIRRIKDMCKPFKYCVPKQWYICQYRIDNGLIVLYSRCGAFLWEHRTDDRLPAQRVVEDLLEIHHSHLVVCK